MLREVFLQVLEMTKAAAVVIAVVLAARLALKKAPKAFSYALWAVVLLRLLCPVSIEAPVSIVPRSEPLAGSYLPAEEPAAVWEAGSGASDSDRDVPPAPAAETGENAAFRWREVWTLLGPYVWLAGAAGMLLYGAVSCAALRRRLTGAVPLRDNIYLTDRVGSPFVLGLLRPRIYLPSALEERERPYILLHEQVHIRRLDHLIKLLAYAALCVHWFNPLVWVAFVLAGKDMEMSCDEAVVKKLGAEIRADYAASLLSLATGRRIAAAAPLAFGEGDVKGRIRNLQRWKQPRRWVSLAAAAACVAVVAACAVDPQQPVSSDVGAASGLMGQYADREDYAAKTMAAVKTVTYYSQYGQRVTVPVLDTRLARLTTLAEVDGVAREGTLELWEFNYYVKVLGSPALVGGQSEHDGWYDLEDPGGYLVAALRYEDGSYDVLSQQPFGDGTAFAGRSYEEILCDCYAAYETEQGMSGHEGGGGQQAGDSSVFPLPTAELYGLTGEEAALYNAVAAFLGNDREELMLPSLTVYGSYGGDHGETYYVCGLLRLHYYGLNGLEDLESSTYSAGSAGNPARITITADGVCTEILETLDGDDNTERIREICGPLTEIAEAWNSGNDAALEGDVLTPAGAQELLQPYLDCYSHRYD